MECLQKVYKFFCCITDPIFPTPYNFSFGSPLDLENNKKLFESNFVRTSKYRWYDFLPSKAFHQYRSFGSTVQTISQHLLLSHRRLADHTHHQSPRTPHCLGPPHRRPRHLHHQRRYLFSHPGYEDYQRYKSDKELNH